MMSSCPYLDPASLLAQSAVSIRLGRRASTCSHTFLATARRAPLNESSVQGSLKTSSTAASAPAQVFQSVGVDHTSSNATERQDSAADRLLPPRHGEPRRGRSALAGRDGALQIAVGSTAEHGVEQLVPALHLDGPRQPATETLEAYDESALTAEAVRAAQHRTPAAEIRRAPTQQESDSGDLAPASVHDFQDPRCAQHRHRRPKPILAAQTQLAHSVGQPDLRHQSLTTNDSALPPHPRTQQPLPLQLPPQPKPPVSDWGQGGGPSLPVESSASAADTAIVVHSRPEAGAKLDTMLSTCTFALGAAGAHAGSAHGVLPSATPLAMQSSDGLSATTSTAITDGYSATQAGPGPPAAMSPPPPPGQPPTWTVGPSGGRWGGLENELVACRSVHSVQRFLQQMGPRVDCKLMGNAVVHLSHLAAEEPPDDDVQRQLLAGLLDDLTQRLRGSARQLSQGLLAALICAMSRLRCYDGPLLREAAAVAREAASELTMRQAAGFFWAYGRFHRDFSFRLEPGWAAAVLQSSLPRLQQAKPQEVAMMLYGCALLREPPPAAALAALLAASLAGMSAAGGPELSMSIWALATLRLYPGREWMQAFLERCDVATRTFASGAAVSNVLHALASMRVQPPAPWMLNFLWQAQRRMNTMDAQSLVMLGWALGRMRYRPDRNWLTRFFRYTRTVVLQQPEIPYNLAVSSQRTASQHQLDMWQLQQQRLQQRHKLRQQQRYGSFARNAAASGSSAVAANVLPPQAYNVLLWTCVRLSCRPMGRWLPQLCAAVQPHMATWPPNELSALLWGLARLRWRPRDDWMTEFCDAARCSLSGFQASDCVMTLLALSKLCSNLGYRVSDGDLANMLAQRLAPYYQRLQTTTLISVLLAISRVTPRVRPARLEEAVAALLDRVRVVGFADASDTASPSAADEVGSGRPVGQHDKQARHVPWGGDSETQDENEKMEPELDHLLDVKEPLPSYQRLSEPQHSASRPTQLLQAPAVLPSVAVALPPLTARECANAVFAVGCVAVSPGYNDTLRALCGQLLRELLPRALRLSAAFNGVDLVLLVHGVAMSRTRVSPQWLRHHEEQALRRLRDGELQPSQLRELHRAYHALDYTPGLLPPRAPGMGLASVGVVDANVGTNGNVSDSNSVAGIASAAMDGSEDEGEVGVQARPSELSIAARARRRRTAQVRRRRVTAAIKRRVVEARQQVAEAGWFGVNVLEAAQGLQVDVAAPLPTLVPHRTTGAELEDACVASSLDINGELELAERELRLRLKTIRRFTAVARREMGRGQSQLQTARIAEPSVCGAEDDVRGEASAGLSS
ncbi:hypothetical protein Vretimale_11491 [Volvox reticuliferus]|uniref:RAP domain-containing protein n=1 Tax=Volvox reticuliferus TaxID=1737510 RepID=A0A8J4CQT4_9CHLO|nr:hypothetical protein Vretifemale_14928 [Volvox reticuliferus]GIM07345.1 hypothetical protein Vretimale_11491 [Volvox reticuliferus]